MERLEQLKHISGYTGKLLRQKFGRGPEYCQASARHHFLVLSVQGFLSPMEEVLLRLGHQVTVATARQAVMTSLLEEMKGVIQSTLDADVTGFYSDWNLPNNNGLIVALIEPPLTEGDREEAGDKDPVFSLLEQEVSRLSALVEKVPERIRVYCIHSKMFIVIREGILVPIEKALVQKGFRNELLIAKEELEKSYFHRDGEFDKLFGRPVQDIFIDWSLTNDNSLICFVLK